MNSKCRSARSQFGPWFDGDLGTAAVRRVEAHLADCAACRDELQAEKQLLAALTALPELTCPQRVDRRLEERLAEAPHRPRLLDRLGSIFGTPGWKTVTACAATLVLVLLFFPIDSGQPVATNTVQDDGDGRITHNEAYQARQRAKTSLTYVAQLLQNTEKKTVNDVLSNTLPTAIRKSIQRVVPVETGGSDS